MRRAAGSLCPLTSRESDVLPLMAAGNTNKQIAAVLHISARTVDQHVANMMHRAGACSRSELTALCYATGVLDGWPPRLPGRTRQPQKKP
jgi:DNA-binding NarL/FixJ family response regulator